MNAKLIDENERRLELIMVIETYYVDFLTRVRDYGIIENLDIPKLKSCDDEEEKCNGAALAPKQTKPDLAKMEKEREAKIRKYKDKRELESQLKELKILVVDVEKEYRDEEIVRKYYLKLIHSFVLSALDEIASYELEKTMLHYMVKVRKGEIPQTTQESAQTKRPLKPIIITRDAVQKEVFGMGYKHLPVLTIEEFYEQRVKDGWFPSPEETKKQNSLANRAMANSDEVKNQEDEESR